MRTFDAMGLELCSFQAKIFEASVSESNLSSPLFVKYYMYSREARSLDEGLFVTGFPDCERIISDMNIKYRNVRGSRKYSEQAMYWMGYLYRYWCYTRQVPSRYVYNLIKPDELNALYFAYHSLDPDAAITRITEARGIASEKTALESLRKAYFSKS